MPYVAMEIITSEIPNMIKNFFYCDEAEDASIFHKYLTVVSEECNSVLSGYFEKIFETLVQHYPKEVYHQLYLSD